MIWLSKLLFVNEGSFPDDIIGRIVGVKSIIIGFSFSDLVNKDALPPVYNCEMGLVDFSDLFKLWKSDVLRNYNFIWLRIRLHRWVFILFWGIRGWIVCLIRDSCWVSIIISLVSDSRFILTRGRLIGWKQVIILKLFWQQDWLILSNVISNQVVIVSKYQQIVMVHQLKVSLLQVIFDLLRSRNCIIFRLCLVLCRSGINLFLLWNVLVCFFYLWTWLCEIHLLQLPGCIGSIARVLTWLIYILLLSYLILLT